MGKVEAPPIAATYNQEISVPNARRMCLAMTSLLVGAISISFVFAPIDPVIPYGLGFLLLWIVPLLTLGQMNSQKQPFTVKRFIPVIPGVIIGAVIPKLPSLASEILIVASGWIWAIIFGYHLYRLESHRPRLS